MKRQQDGYLEDAKLRKEILEHIEKGRYRLTKHADEELKNDDLDLKDALDILKNGTHNRKKTEFNNKHQMWHYAIEGITKDLNNIRVIIAFSGEMLIITAMEV
jgi:hypothetical protein